MFELLQVKEKVLREGEFLGISKLGKEMLTSKEAKEKRQKLLMKYFSDILCSNNIATLYLFI